MLLEVIFHNNIAVKKNLYSTNLCKQITGTCLLGKQFSLVGSAPRCHHLLEIRSPVLQTTSLSVLAWHLIAEYSLISPIQFTWTGWGMWSLMWGVVVIWQIPECVRALKPRWNLKRGHKRPERLCGNHEVPPNIHLSICLERWQGFPDMASEDNGRARSVRDGQRKMSLILLHAHSGTVRTRANSRPGTYPVPMDVLSMSGIYQYKNNGCQLHLAFYLVR